MLLEAAITITLLLAFVSGIIDLWKFCRDAETLLTASRHGARAAAATGHAVESGPSPAAARGYTGSTNRGLQEQVECRAGHRDDKGVRERLRAHTALQPAHHAADDANGGGVLR